MSTVHGLIEYDRVAAPRERHDSLIDRLTGLPRWELLIDLLEVALGRSRETGNDVALFLLFAEGAEILDVVGFAERLRGALHPRDTLARVGLSDFAALCSDIRTRADAADIAQRLARSTRAVTCRLGYAIANPEQTADDLIREVIARTDVDADGLAADRTSSRNP